MPPKRKKAAPKRKKRQEEEEVDEAEADETAMQVDSKTSTAGEANDEEAEDKAPAAKKQRTGTAAAGKKAANKKQEPTIALIDPQALRDVFVEFVAKYLEGFEVVLYSRVSKSWQQAISNPAADGDLWKSLCEARFGFTMLPRELEVYRAAFNDSRPWFHCYKQ